MDIMAIVTWFQLHWVDIINVLTGLIAVASIIVKLTPTIKDDNFLLAVIKFLSKYIALNRTTNDAAVRSEQK
jgi:hypothetical protein